VLFDSFSLGPITLANRVVMAPMTRNRATPTNVPTPAMATYYAQRATVGLIVTEGVSPSPNGLGYPRMPGLFTPEQAAAWRVVTYAVHAEGGKIFAQLMHTGRASHAANLPFGAEVLSSTAAALPGEIWTDVLGQQVPTTPRAMTDADITATIAEFVVAAQFAVAAGFDGIELHGANGYLIEQFINGNVNTRTDAWGGSAAARNRFALAVVDAVVEAIGAARVAIRLSPYGTFNATGAFGGVDEQFVALARELGARQLAYLHLVDHSSMGAPTVPVALVGEMRRAFGGVYIASGGFDKARAVATLQNGGADLIAFGRPILANPDFVARLQQDEPLTAPDFATFYTPGETGYTDYPVLAGTAV
jgi:N-ethylmaleimide reductase